MSIITLPSYKFSTVIHEDINAVMYCGVKEFEQIPAIVSILKAKYFTFS